ncbi:MULTISPECIES: hypothetical protein [Lysinibacillus]|uniref:hypothetical protein n=1 Tax=Lysinibacillus TaxID=400634 RepID=UPI0006AF530D|nr:MULTISPECIES: hypothetical protein [Lysinibacillus]KOS61477.1 hypothetical protein AN161_17960 [Lysinibacillus sp. FJAT-14222]
MAYQTPTCSCGGKLLFVELEYTEVHYRITKKGEKSKKVYDKVDKIGVNEQLMKCEDCGNRYSWNHDDKGRIIIG